MKILLAFMFVFQSIVLVAQTDSLKINRIIDDMTDDTTYQGSRPLVLSDAGTTYGIEIDFFIKGPSTCICIESFNLGSCHEKDQLIILFADSSKIHLQPENKFECDYTTYFFIYEEQMISLLKTTPIKKIRFINGRTFDTFTGPVPKSKQRYFIQYYKGIKALGGYQ